MEMEGELHLTASYIIKIIVIPNAKQRVRPVPSLTMPTIPIIWDYVKCFPFVWAKPAQSTAFSHQLSRIFANPRKRLFANFYNHPKKRIKCAEAPKVLWLKVKL